MQNREGSESLGADPWPGRALGLLAVGVLTEALVAVSFWGGEAGRVPVSATALILALLALVVWGPRCRRAWRTPAARPLARGQRRGWALVVVFAGTAVLVLGGSAAGVLSHALWPVDPVVAEEDVMHVADVVLMPFILFALPIALVLPLVFVAAATKAALSNNRSIYASVFAA